ncbi:hypothetical protein F5141DRAFT_1128005 [Pisolithus sp. B1]|nr:hypothetical protein F5141DRAFT_1128005 [Pisolithus sp. B1]
MENGVQDHCHACASVLACPVLSLVLPCVSIPLTMLTKPSHHDSHWVYTTLFGCVWSCIGCSHIYATSLPV